MNKLFKISVITVLVLALAFAVVGTLGTNSMSAAGNACLDVGWNTRALSCTFGTFAWQNPLRFSIGGIFLPNVGWNT